MNLLTIEQASDRLGLSSRTVRRYIHSGELPAYRLGSRGIRIDEADLSRLITPLEVNGEQA